MAGENEAGQTLLVAAEGVEGAVEGAVEGEGDVMYVTREDGQVCNICTIVWHISNMSITT